MSAQTSVAMDSLFPVPLTSGLTEYRVGRRSVRDFLLGVTAARTGQLLVDSQAPANDIGGQRSVVGDNREGAGKSVMAHAPHEQFRYARLSRIGRDVAMLIPAAVGAMAGSRFLRW